MFLREIQTTFPKSTPENSPCRTPSSAKYQTSSSSALVHVEYDAGLDRHEVDSRPDALGNFTVVMRVPQDNEIGFSNVIRVRFVDDDRSMVMETAMQRISHGQISLSPASGREGTSITITGEGFPRYALVDAVEFRGREITPVPRPVTDGSGQVVFTVRIPG